MLQGVYIINDAGETIGSIEFGDFKINEIMFGGFVSAIQMYSQKASGTNVSEITLDKYRIIISNTDRGFVVTSHDKNDPEATSDNKKIVEILSGIMGEIVTDDTIALIREVANVQGEVVS